MILFIGSGCSMDYRSKDDGNGGSSSTTSDEAKRLSAILYLKSSDIDVKAELITNKSNENVISLSSGQFDYMHYKFNKNGSSEGQEANSSGINAAVLAKEGATLRVRGSLVVSSGDYAHGIFAYGERAIVTVSDCVVSTKGNNSSGLMTSANGVMAANHVTAETFGSSSPALRVYDGGGSITALRGKYTTSGANSPVILSEGEISATHAKLDAESSQAVITNGKSSVILASCDVTADHTTENSRAQAVLMYFDGSGNPITNKGEFIMTEGSIISAKGDIFYVSNVAASITLNNVDITNNDSSGAFLRAEASQLGISGVNGGHVDLTANDQYIDGNIYLDDLSDLNMYLTGDSYFTGAINPSSTDARIYVEITGSKWILTGDSHIDSLTCDTTGVNLNGHVLYVAGQAYEEGTESIGEAIDFASSRTKKISVPTTSDDVTSGDVDADTESADIIS